MRDKQFSRWRVLIWMLALIFAPGFLACAQPTFDQWREACARLPLNRSLEMRMPPKELLPLKNFAEMERVLDGFFGVMTNGPVARDSNWVLGAPAAGNFLNVQRGWFMPPELPFEPFAQKLVVTPKTKVFLQGDLHGDVHSLLAVLGKLNERKMLAGFEIKDPDLLMVFMGDYTDRGLYGVEVLYTLLRLKLANPERVHFSRGNHEDLNLIARYGFLAEGRAKYGREFNAAKILRAYDFLPVVIYLGAGNDFVQICHGGMEPGFSPSALIGSSGTNRFQLIGMLKQASFLKANPDWLKADPAAARDAVEQFKDFQPTAPTTPTVIGFMWNDFTVFGDEAAFAHNPDRAFVYGRPAVEYLLRVAGGANARVHAVIRGHQHSGIANPMMRRLVASRGLFRHWQEPNGSAEARNAAPGDLAGKVETGASRPIPSGSVWTFNVSPDSVYGAGCGFNFATYGILTLGEKFSDWRIEVNTVVPPRL